MTNPTNGVSAGEVRPPARREGGGCLSLWCVLWTGLSVLYLLALVVLEKVLPETYLPAYLATYLPQVLLVLPLGVALFFCVIFWRRRLLTVNLLLILVAIILLMPPTLSPIPRQAPASHVRVLTWNVHEESGHALELREAIAKQQPDIVCLQEAQNDAFVTLMPKTETAHTREVTTLTTGHIESRKAVRLGPTPNYRWALETRIRLPQGRLTVLNVHFITAFTPRTVRRNRYDLPDFLLETREARNLEAEAVVDWLRQTPGPRLVVGDFNSPPNSQVYRAIAAVAQDAFVSGLGWGYTYRRDKPMVRIDHVFCSEEITPLRATVVDGGASDHRLVMADLGL